MPTTNSEILRNYFEEVVNQRRLDRLPAYFSPQYIGHSSPYVGLGIMPDDSSKVKVIIRTVYPGAPADGKLQEGDEILQFQDGDHIWKNYDELRGSTWGQGVLGSSITIRVKRDGNELEFSLVRGLVQGFDFKYEILAPMISEYFQEWPDIHFRLVQIIESGDLVAYSGENQGHNIRYNRSAVWGECGIVRIQGGLIAEWWSQEDSFARMKQLGYSIQEPVPVKA